MDRSLNKAIQLLLKYIIFDVCGIVLDQFVFRNTCNCTHIVHDLIYFDLHLIENLLEDIEVVHNSVVHV